MASITEGLIRRALREVKRTRKQQLLVDGEGRGTGRLVLILKPMPTRVSHVDGTAVARWTKDEDDARIVPGDVSLGSEGNFRPGLWAAHSRQAQRQSRKGYTPRYSLRPFRRLRCAFEGREQTIVLRRGAAAQ